MLLLLNIAQLVLYIGLLALTGQGVLHVLTGSRRTDNLIYQLFQVINRPWLWLARGRGWVAFALTGVLYAAVTLAKIGYCLHAAMVGCR